MLPLDHCETGIKSKAPRRGGLVTCFCHQTTDILKFGSHSDFEILLYGLLSIA